MVVVYVNGCITQGPLKKWTEHSQELHLLKIHSRGRGAPIHGRLYRWTENSLPFFISETR